SLRPEADQEVAGDSTRRDRRAGLSPSDISIPESTSIRSGRRTLRPGGDRERDAERVLVRREALAIRVDEDRIAHGRRGLSRIGAVEGPYLRPLARREHDDVSIRG